MMRKRVGSALALAPFRLLYQTPLLCWVNLISKLFLVRNYIKLFSILLQWPCLRMDQFQLEKSTDATDLTSVRACYPRMRSSSRTMLAVTNSTLWINFQFISAQLWKAGSSPRNQPLNSFCLLNLEILWQLSETELSWHKDELWENVSAVFHDPVTQAIIRNAIVHFPDILKNVFEIGGNNWTCIWL